MPTVLERKILARINRLLREADKAERDVLDQIVIAIERLQRVVRTAVIGSNNYASIMAGLAAEFNLTQETVIAAIVGGRVEARRLGMELVDQALEVAGRRQIGVALLPSADDEALTRTRLHVEDAISTGRQRVGVEVLRYSAGQADLQATLRSIGSQPDRSRALGRVSERLTATATSELGEAHTAGVLQRAEVEPGMRKRWMASHKRRPRRSHLEVERRYMPGGPEGPIPMDAKFRVGRHWAWGPRSADLPASETAHCGCRLIPVLPG